VDEKTWFEEGKFTENVIVLLCGTFPLFVPF
jgi:hypothetical protein